MNRLVWDDEIHSIGIPMIDQQHRHFIELIAQTTNSAAAGFDQVHLDELFRSLVDYLNYHFLFEETLMRKFGYPDVEEHVRHHAVFAAKVRRLQSTYESSLGDRDSIIPVLTNLLSKWIISHLIEEDQKMGPFLRECLCGKSEEEVLALVKVD